MPSSNYPLMSQSQQEAAPWNQPEIPEKDFDVTVFQTLRKDTTVTTDDYVPEKTAEPENGTHEVFNNTEDTNWEYAYENDEHYTPLQLIQLFKRYLESELHHTKDVSRFPSFLSQLIEECEGWTEEEFEVQEA